MGLVQMYLHFLRYKYQEKEFVKPATTLDSFLIMDHMLSENSIKNIPNA